MPRKGSMGMVDVRVPMPTERLFRAILRSDVMILGEEFSAGRIMSASGRGEISRFVKVLQDGKMWGIVTIIVCQCVCGGNMGIPVLDTTGGNKQDSAEISRFEWVGSVGV